jgi:hypothetical protein
LKEESDPELDPDPEPDPNSLVRSTDPDPFLAFLSRFVFVWLSRLKIMCLLVSYKKEI